MAKFGKLISQTLKRELRKRAMIPNEKGGRSSAVNAQGHEMEKIRVTHQQMNLILMAVEHGVRQAEKGNNLQAALASVFELYEVKQPENAQTRNKNKPRAE